MKKYTIQEFIQYLYVRNLARLLLGDASELERRVFIQNRFKAVKSDEDQWVRCLRQHHPDLAEEKHCLFCGRENQLKWDYLVPVFSGFEGHCMACSRIQGRDNHAWVCWDCRLKRKGQGLFTYVKSLYPEDQEYYDRISPAVCIEYLKILYYCYLCSGLLESKGLFPDGKMTVLDLERFFYSQGEQNLQPYQY